VPRRGFTLLEILLVLAIMAAITGMVWPALMRALTDHQLRVGAQVVRDELSNTRRQAVDTGLMYQFLYEPGGRRFCSIPCERESAPADNRRVRITANTAIDELPRRAGELPEGLVFPKDSVISFQTQRLPSELFAGLPGADSLATVGWSDPVLFHTDGGAEGPNVTLSDPRKRLVVTVEIRDLTGSVKVGNVEQEGSL
jgi:prepilin-type N-terminal cleavage/methylation domain-containing protein